MGKTKKALLGDCHETQKDRKNRFRILRWAFAFVTAWVGTSQSISRDWFPNTFMVWVATAMILVLGIGMLIAYRRFIREADELLRKIELEALALASGVGLVGGVAYWVLQKAGIFAYADGFNLVVMFMASSYIVAIIAGRWRYA